MNEERLTLSCLDSIETQTVKPYEVIIIDQGKQKLHWKFSEKYNFNTTRVSFSENRGFAEGNNRGIYEARGNYIFCLNNDTLLKPDCIERLVKTIERCNDTADMYAFKLVLPGGTVGSYGIEYKKYGLAKEVKSLNRCHKISMPCGGAAVYSRYMLDKIKTKYGYFDGRYFAYSEDVDLGLRALNNNFYCQLVDSEIMHYQGMTTNKFPKTCYYLSIRNRIITYKRQPKNIYYPIFIGLQVMVYLKYLIKGIDMLPAIQDGFNERFRPIDEIAKRYDENIRG